MMERLTREPARQNPYRDQLKPKGSPRCRVCGSVFRDGQWLSRERAAARRVQSQGTMKCPACRQLQDHYAMGVVELHGKAWQAKEAEVLQAIENSEQIARDRNDQERILWTRNYRGALRIYCTTPELAHHIGRKLERAFKGYVEYDRSTEEPYLRVRWWSDSPHIARGEHGAPLSVKRRAHLDNAQLKQRKKSRAWRGRGRER